MVSCVLFYTPVKAEDIDESQDTDGERIELTEEPGIIKRPNSKGVDVIICHRIQN